MVGFLGLEGLLSPLLQKAEGFADRLEIFVVANFHFLLGECI